MKLKRILLALLLCVLGLNLATKADTTEPEQQQQATISDEVQVNPDAQAVNLNEETAADLEYDDMADEEFDDEAIDE